LIDKDNDKKISLFILFLFFNLIFLNSSKTGVVMILFGGFYINVDSLPVGARWFIN